MNPYFLAFDLLMMVLLALCLRHARQRGGPAVAGLIAGVLFGLFLEWATIQQLQAYTYGRFGLMLGEVPLAIGVGWGVIIYSAQLFSDATSLPEWARPLLDGLLALVIDLSMDAIAIRLGMWDWGQGLTFQYFGVPWGNFWAWFWVVSAFSAGLRLFRRVPPPYGQWLAPVGALLVGLLTVLGTNALYVFVIPRSLQPVAVLLELGGALVLVLWQRPRLVRSLSPLAAGVPLSFHLFFLLAGLLSGWMLQTPFLLGVSLAMLGVSLGLHGLPLPRAMPLQRTR